MRGATSHVRQQSCHSHNFNPRAPCGARPTTESTFSSGTYFNPRAPCGARLGSQTNTPLEKRFQSTRPMRGATRNLPHLDRAKHNFNPRAPCGARRSRVISSDGAVHFNPRAPCGARLPAAARGQGRFEFQSTRPMRGATPAQMGRYPLETISIHAPHAGRDLM